MGRWKTRGSTLRTKPKLAQYSCEPRLARLTLKASRQHFSIHFSSLFLSSFSKPLSLLLNHPCASPENPDLAVMATQSRAAFNSITRTCSGWVSRWGYQLLLFFHVLIVDLSGGWHSSPHLSCMLVAVIVLFKILCCQFKMNSYLNCSILKRIIQTHCHIMVGMPHFKAVQTHIFDVAENLPHTFCT